MSAELLEFIPRTSPDEASAQFSEIGHVGLTGLYDPALADQAISDSRRLYSRDHFSPVVGGRVATLNCLPDARRQEALYLILQGIQDGAALLGHDIRPSTRNERPHTQIIDMEKGARGKTHLDVDSLSDIVAVTNLRYRSVLWFEDSASEDGVEYEIEPGRTVFQDLSRNLRHKGTGGPDGQRVGLAVAKRRVPG